MFSPREIIKNIQKNKYGVGLLTDSRTQNVIQRLKGALNRALEQLSEDLYSNENHFVLELIQNADDNYYENGVTPFLKFIVDREKILVQNNKLILRNFTVDTYYYSPQKIKNEGYIFSAGDAHRDYNILIKAIGKQYKIKIYTDNFLPIDIFKNYSNVEWISLSKNIFNLKDAILKSKLVVLPVPVKGRNLTYGNSIAFISMALGKIVLCPDNIYYRRYIQDGYNGFLYKRLDEKEIKNKIMEIMNISDVLIRKIEKNARKTIVEKASNCSIVKEIFDVYIK